MVKTPQRPVPRPPKPGPPHLALSARETEVLGLIAQGNRPTDVAKQIGLSIGTITTHVHRIKRKLGLRSIGDLVLYWHKHGLGQ
jgi:DNA-binding CsgD family transcriptional regulator